MKIEREPMSAAPRSGRSVRGSRTGRPIMALLDLLGRRWALRVLWELRDAPVATFRELQHRCGQVSSSVLTDRLTELRAAGIVERGDAGYHLTAEGRKLLPVMLALDEWATRWANSSPEPD